MVWVIQRLSSKLSRSVVGVAQLGAFGDNCIPSMNESCMKIRWLRSLRTGRCFPTVLFAGDTDMATAGLLSLSSTSRSEVAVAHLTAKEVDAANSRASSLIEDRINCLLGRSDFRSVPLLRVVEQKSQPGIPFRGFRSSYRPPELFYRDIFNSRGEAVVDRDETMVEFRNAGGIVTHVT